MKLIALCGAAGAGKDTVADMLPARKLAFADTLYAEVAAAWEVEIESLKSRETKELQQRRLAIFECKDEGFMEFRFQDAWSEARSPRQILQWWGDYRRSQDPDYFVKLTEAAIYHGWGAGERVVITDIRFPNEAAMVRQLGGQIWQIHRPGYDAGGTGHASDTDGSEFSPDCVVLNSGDLIALEKLVLALWAES